MATEAFQSALDRAAQLKRDDNIDTLGTSLEADRSVPTALACFASCPNSFADAVGRAIGLGGDVDTIAAMVGALSGARLGLRAIPSHLLAKLENAAKGRDYLDHLAQLLHGMHCSGGRAHFSGRRYCCCFPAWRCRARRCHGAAAAYG